MSITIIKGSPVTYSIASVLSLLTNIEIEIIEREIKTDDKYQSSHLFISESQINFLYSLIQVGFDGGALVFTTNEDSLRNKHVIFKRHPEIYQPCSLKSNLSTILEKSLALKTIKKGNLDNLRKELETNSATLLTSEIFPFLERIEKRIATAEEIGDFKKIMENLTLKTYSACHVKIAESELKDKLLTASVPLHFNIGECLLYLYDKIINDCGFETDLIRQVFTFWSNQVAGTGESLNVNTSPYTLE